MLQGKSGPVFSLMVGKAGQAPEPVFRFGEKSEKRGISALTNPALPRMIKKGRRGIP